MVARRLWAMVEPSSLAIWASIGRGRRGFEGSGK